MLAGGSHLYRGGKKAQMPALMLSLGQQLYLKGAGFGSLYVQWSEVMGSFSDLAEQIFLDLALFVGTIK
jgi:hypothetical protein